MSDSERQNQLRTAVLEWQKKYHVSDGDPLLASLELWEIYLSSLRFTPQTNPAPTFLEFRASLEQLEQLSKLFTKLAAEVIQEIRAASKSKQETKSSHLITLAIASTAALFAGMLIGRFIL